jgi:hypothetical protein
MATANTFHIYEGGATTTDVENFVKSLPSQPGSVALQVQGMEEDLDYSWYEETLFPLCDTFVDAGWNIRVIYEGEFNYNLMSGMYKNKAYEADVCEVEFESFEEWEKEALPKKVEDMKQYLESKGVEYTGEDLTAYSKSLSSSFRMVYDKQGL